MNTILVEEAKSHVTSILSSQLESCCHYHNVDHTMSVYAASLRLAEESNIDDQEKEALLLASLFHDLGFVQGEENHEERSALMAEEWLSNKVDNKQLELIKSLIQSTVMSVEPNSLLEEILKDADLSHLAKQDYLEISDSLREEKEIRLGKKLSKKDWVNTNIGFFKKHKYKSPAGKKIFESGKAKNLAKLAQLATKKKKKKDKIKKAITISESKAANTQFKTALRNHIDLSAIADNKANMMLSVNALILTISIPALGIQIVEHPNMIVPFAALLITCMLSIIYATLATKPIVMSGHTDFRDVKDLNANLFFFGNFYKMTRAKYQEGIQYVIENEDSLDSSIIKDLFDLGRALGGKYRYLSICYSIFMFGLIITSLSFLAILLINRFGPI